MSIDAAFDAKMEWRYGRRYQLPGSVEAHAIRDTATYATYKRSTTVVGFNKVIEAALDGGDPQPPATTFNVDAAASLHILPSLQIGMFADASSSLLGVSASAGAKASVNVDLKMIARATFKFRAGIGTVNHIAPMPRDDQSSCNALSSYSGNAVVPSDWGPTCCGAEGSMPYCFGQCSELHDTQFNVEMQFEIGIALQLFMKAGFGTYKRKLDLMWWVVPGGPLGLTLKQTKAYTPLIASNLHILSLCYVLLPSLLPGYEAPEGIDSW
jgi:hypothetical protein